LKNVSVTQDYAYCDLSPTIVPEFDIYLGLLYRLRWKDDIKIEGNSMTVRQRRYSKEEMARRGQERYESGIRQQVEAGNLGKIVAIDIETGDFEVGETIITATDRLFERCPEAQPWGIRIGQGAVYHFGSQSLKKN